MLHKKRELLDVAPVIVARRLLPSLLQPFQHQFPRHIRVSFAFGGAGNLTHEPFLHVILRERSLRPKDLGCRGRDASLRSA